MGGKGNWGEAETHLKYQHVCVCVCVLMAESGLGGGFCIVVENCICTL